MTREQLLTPGDYIGLPKSLARDRRIGSTAKLVWAVIGDRLGKNAVAWPGERTIAADAGISFSSARRAVAELTAAGWISIASRPGKSHNFTLLLAPDPAQVEHTQPDPAQNEHAQVEQTTLLKLSTHPAQIEQTTLPKLSTELLNRTTEEQPKITTEVTAVVTAHHSASPVHSKADGVVASTVPTASHKSEKLNQADIEKICESIESMKTYLLFGKDALYTPGEYPPTNLSWRKYMTDPEMKDMNISAWDTNTFMGFYWYSVSYCRAHRGIKLTLPMWSRLAGDIKNLRKTMTNKQLHLLIACTTQYFNLIKWMSGKAGLTMELNESSLSHGLIRSAAQSINNMTLDERNKVITDYNNRTTQRAA